MTDTTATIGKIVAIVATVTIATIAMLHPAWLVAAFLNMLNGPLN